jgi:hypothetical protein
MTTFYSHNTCNALCDATQDIHADVAYGSVTALTRARAAYAKRGVELLSVEPALEAPSDPTMPDAPRWLVFYRRRA